MVGHSLGEVPLGSVLWGLHLGHVWLPRGCESGSKWRRDNPGAAGTGPTSFTQVSQAGLEYVVLLSSGSGSVDRVLTVTKL